MGGPRRDDGSWKPVLRPAYTAARARHAAEREDAYLLARLDVLERGFFGPQLHMRDIDAEALDNWHRTWVGKHPFGAGKWNWPLLVENLRAGPQFFPSPSGTEAISAGWRWATRHGGG